MTSAGDPPSDGRPRYLVGVDGSEPSIDALAWALDRAVQEGAEVVAVAMWHFPAVALERPSQAQKLHQETEAMLADAVRRGVERSDAGADVPVTELVYQYPAAERLVDMSESADLVVVGRRSRRGLGTLGSVSERVVSHAHCPVVVIPAR